MVVSVKNLTSTCLEGEHFNGSRGGFRQISGSLSQVGSQSRRMFNLPMEVLEKADHQHRAVSQARDLEGEMCFGTKLCSSALPERLFAFRKLRTRGSLATPKINTFH